MRYRSMGDVDDVQQAGDAVLVQGEEMLTLLYFCLNAGIRKLRYDGLPPARAERLKGVVYRALMSPSGREDAAYVLAEAHSDRQDTEMWSVAEAAEELGIGVRQVRRLAEEGLGKKRGRDWWLPKDRVCALKQERDWKARNGSRTCPRAA